MTHCHRHENNEGCRCHKGDHANRMHGMGHKEGCQHEGECEMTEKERLLKKKEHLENRLKEVDQALNAL